MTNLLKELKETSRKITGLEEKRNFMKKELLTISQDIANIKIAKTNLEIRFNKEVAEDSSLTSDVKRKAALKSKLSDNAEYFDLTSKETVKNNAIQVLQEVSLRQNLTELTTYGRQYEILIIEAKYDLAT